MNIYDICISIYTYIHTTFVSTNRNMCSKYYLSLSPQFRIQKEDVHWPIGSRRILRTRCRLFEAPARTLTLKFWESEFMDNENPQWADVHIHICIIGIYMYICIYIHTIYGDMLDRRMRVYVCVLMYLNVYVTYT